MLNIDNLGETVLVNRDHTDFLIYAPIHTFKISGVTNFVYSSDFECAFIWSDYSYTFLTMLLQELDMHMAEREGVMQNAVILEVVQLINNILGACDGVFAMQAEDDDIEYIDKFIDELSKEVEFVLHMKNSKHLHYFKVIGSQIIYRLVSGTFFAFGEDANFATSLHRNGYSTEEIYEELVQSKPSLSNRLIEQLWEAKSNLIANARVVPKTQKVKKSSKKTKKSERGVD